MNEFADHQETIAVLSRIEDVLSDIVHHLQHHSDDG